MIAQALLAVVADLVFKSVAVLRRSYITDIDRYLAQRGFREPSMIRTARAR